MAEVHDPPQHLTHHYHSVLADGHSKVHLGDVHYHLALTQGENLSESLGNDDNCTNVQGHVLTTRVVQKESPWRDSFECGFYLEKVPLISHFIGRDEYFEGIRDHLDPNMRTSRRKVYALSGLGGMGKTQLAVEFARRYQTFFTSIFFIDGSSKDNVLQSLMRVFRQVANVTSIDAKKHGSAAPSTPEGIAQRALEWFTLDGNTNWLLIFDNVDLMPSDPGGYVLETYFPTKDCGSILITTRLACLPVAATTKRLAKMNAQQSMHLLSQSSVGENRTEMVPFRDGVSDNTEMDGQKQLIEQLDGLPLAISQASKLIESLGITIEEYLDLYNNSMREVIDMLMPESVSSDVNRASIRTTWTTSINILKQRMASEPDAGLHRCAYLLLQLFTYFDPTDLDFTLLQNTKLASNPPVWVCKVFRSKISFYSTVKVLLDLSLVDKTSSNGVYSMHRVVFDWMCTYESSETSKDLINIAAAAVAWACPVTYSPFHWAETQQKLLVHANILKKRLDGHGSFIQPVWYDQTSQTDRKRAAELWECDVKTIEKAKVYQPVGDIARLYSAAGEPEMALALVDDSLLAATHKDREPDMSYYVLLYEKATILLDLGLGEMADAALAEALEGFLRLDNPFWVVCVETLEGTRERDFDAAIAIYQKALATARKGNLCLFYPPAWLAIEHIDAMLQDVPQRRRSELEAIKDDAESIAYNAPNAQEALHSLANLYFQLGMNSEAERLYLKILDWRTRRYGRDALEVLTCIQDLSLFYFAQARQESIYYDTERLRLTELHHGSTSYDARMAHYFLAESFEKHNRLEKARTHYQRALRIQSTTYELAAAINFILDAIIRISETLGDEEIAKEYRFERSSQYLSEPAEDKSLALTTMISKNLAF